MTAPKPVARPKSELKYQPVQTKKPARKLTRDERRNGVTPKGDRFDGFSDVDPTPAVEAPKPTPVKQPFVLQPHLTHRPFSGLKQNLKESK